MSLWCFWWQDVFSSFALITILSKTSFCFRYRNNAQRRSKLIHDRPIKPLDLAVYWTEFVIRHKGAPHLRVAGVDLPWYKYLLLDVISFVILVSTTFIFIIYFIVRKICCARRKSRDKLKKNLWLWCQCYFIVIITIVTVLLQCL